MTDRILLRTLTRKSKLNLGKFKDKTIQELLNQRENKHLVSLYYRYETINFTDDILKELKIERELVIQKPGSDNEMFRENMYDVFGFDKTKKKKPFKLESKMNRKDSTNR